MFVFTVFNDLHYIHMATYPTKLAEVFSTKVMVIYYANAVAEDITNQDYEGEVKDKASVLNIMTFSKILSHSYTGATMTVDDLTESSGQLTTDQAKDFYFRVKSYDKFRSYIKNPEGTILAQTALELKKVIDTYIMTFYEYAAAGNRVGTDYTTGSVTVDVTTGVVTGSGTAFVAGDVGKGFKAAGHSHWYRIATYSSGTSITIVDDLHDPSAAAYTGGAISAGAAYTLQARTPVQMTSSTIFDQLNQLQVKLTNAEIPAEDRWCVVPPEVGALIKLNANFNPSGVPSAYEKLTVNGKIGGTLAGFTIYESPRVNGNSTDGWHIMAGHKSAITFALGLTETGMEDLIGNFGKAYKSLYVYGAKVVDERMKALTELFGKL
jgi:hypothetical protein